MGSLEQDDPIRTIPKRIIICCDGTWQSSVSSIKNVPSNVTRLARAIARTSTDSDGKVWQQIVHYDAGIGTGEISEEERTRQGSFGIGFVGNVIEAYNFIALNYATGDQIFCFGFSRGAYTARAVAGLVNDIGVISPRDLQDFPDLYQLYQNNKDSHGFRKSKHYREWVNGALSEADSRAGTTAPQSTRYGKAHHADAPEASRVVQVVGVFDTVGSLGIPDVSWLKGHLNWLEKCLGIPSFGFHNVALSPYIRHAFHALSLDEHRAPFSPTLWHYPGDGELSTKKPKESLDKVQKSWEKIRSDPRSTLRQKSDAWAKLIDCEMYDELNGTDSELLQVWFPGFHDNAGGGSTDPLKDRKGDFEQIALISFAWMCEQTAPYLQLEENLLSLARNSVQDRYDLIHSPLHPPAPSNIGDWLTMKASSFIGKVESGHSSSRKVSREIQYGWATGPVIDSFKGIMLLAGSATRTPGQYVKDKSNGVRLGKTNEMIHPTVQFRIGNRYDYRPEALKGFTRRQAGRSGFEWKSGSVTIPEYLVRPGDTFSRYIADQDRLEQEYRATEFLHEIDRIVQA
ncbi:hypothetical protein SCAR479_07130 [Seiridium cardinale]|uniref:T6SS Phospholipase effector Tle1-like catalytic domain-containing protein n=1 Tax=Seiridium cardinale TaxID=138064 RepID=A0ABR2XQZ0_9PEZI